jgi:hypothetical protein
MSVYAGLGNMQFTCTLCSGWAGRPTVSCEVRDLIRRMSRENALWGAPHIHGELLKLGIQISETSVAKYLVRRRKPPSQTWRTFLDNHVGTWCRSTSLLCRQSDSRCCTCFWCWRMTGAGWSISMSPLIPRRKGQYSNLDKDTTNRRPAEDKPCPEATVFSSARLGGLHHRYCWRAAA